MMELNVNHIPYCVGLTKLIVRGTTCSEISILMHFKKNEPTIFLFTTTLRASPFFKKFLKSKFMINDSI